MYVSLAEASTVGVDKVGMYFSSGIPSADNGPSSIIGPTPQVYSSQIIVDQNNWVLISGTFLANGTESYIHVGNFFSETEVNAQSVGGDIVDFAYYYVENVSVVQLTSSNNLDFTICEGDCVTVFNNVFCAAGSYVISPGDCNGSGITITVNVATVPAEQVNLNLVNNIDCANPTATLDASGTTGLPTATFTGWTGPNNFQALIL